MRAAHKRRIGKHSLLLLALLTVAFFVVSCRSNEVEVPPLTGPSGHRLFITMEASPDHLVIHAPGRPRETSRITLQLKNQQGIGVAGQNVKLRILTVEGVEFNIGALSAYNITTDAAGFGRVTYTAPDSSEQLVPTQVLIRAILTDPAYVNEVTDQHLLDLEMSAVTPGNCAGTGALVPQFTINPNPAAINQEVCFDGTASTGGVFAAGFDFGDGSRAGGLFACHAYRAAGGYPVTLIVQDANHHCNQITQSVTINTGTPATCTIVVSPTPTIVDTDVNFTAVITDPDGRVRRFAWNFGDGSSTTTNRNTVVHRYTDVGSFTVVLTITDDQGNVNTCQTGVSVTLPTCPTITVSPGGLPAGQVGVAYPDQNFSAVGGQGPYTFSFSGTLPSGLTFTPVTNGATLTGTPTLDGSFQFSVTATDVNGCTGTVNFSMTIAPAGP